MTTTLDLDLRITDADGFYDALIDMHRGLSDEDSQAVNARLILILANQIGDRDILDRALAIARNPQEARVG